MLYESNFRVANKPSYSSYSSSYSSSINCIICITRLCSSSVLATFASTCLYILCTIDGSLKYIQHVSGSFKSMPEPMMCT